MNTVAIIQARMASTRLPGKIMADIAGHPLLWYVVSRSQLAHSLHHVLVATTDQQQDDVVADFCAQYGIPCFRGDEDDVLDRYYQAAKWVQAEVVVRLTADCPLLDPAVIDRVVQTFQQGAYEYVSNTLHPTYPDGLDVEVFSFNALEQAWYHANLRSQREHVTPYIRSQPSLFRVHNVRYHQDLSHLRWTVDEPEDLEFVRRVYHELGTNDAFGMVNLLDFLHNYPELLAINAHFERNEGYQKSLLKDSPVQKGKEAMSTTGQDLYTRARKRIPGGTQLLSKRPEMFLPEQWPSYYRKARGVEVWDLDGNCYLDMSHNGIGTCILGAADSDVDAAVKAAIDTGSMSTLNCPEEVELADLLCDLHPWADMVRYARSGGEAMAIAIRIARAHTHRSRIAFCGYHGWSDWYLAANLAEEQALDGHLLPGLAPAGVPRELIGTALPFRYNNLEELYTVITDHRDNLAAIVMEPIRDQEPAPGFLEEVRELASKIGAVLVFDEITAGFRLTNGGAHLQYGQPPDIAVFAKAMSNGYPMAAIIGNEMVMQSAQDTFISSTYWTERIGPTAALATIRKHRQYGVHNHLTHMGTLVQDGWLRAAEQTGLHLHVGGIKPLSHFSFADEQAQVARTLFTQLMLEKSFLAGSSFYATFAHQEQHIQRYLEAVTEVFSRIAHFLEQGTLQEQLKGPLAHSGFHRLT
jgi:glutamate-1-semialdehyde aminotransferase/spore coat polysaccharide biosynthesis protein SpsF (cytidylyltransferase family)